MLDFSLLPDLYEGKFGTQTAFAKELGVTQSYVSQIVRNEKQVSLTLFSKMAKALDMRLSDLSLALEKNITVSA